MSRVLRQLLKHICSTRLIEAAVRRARGLRRAWAALFGTVVAPAGGRAARVLWAPRYPSPLGLRVRLGADLELGPRIVPDASFQPLPENPTPGHGPGAVAPSPPPPVDTDPNNPPPGATTGPGSGTGFWEQIGVGVSYSTPDLGPIPPGQASPEPVAYTYPLWGWVKLPDSGHSRAYALLTHDADRVCG